MSEIDLPDTPRWVSAAARVIQALPAGRYRAMNWVAGHGGRPFWGQMPADLGGYRFRCDLRDVLMREVCLTGRYEPQETILLQELLRPGMTFVDVGANWGYFTLTGAHLVGAGGRVVSVEADPRACRTVDVNVAKNGLSWVTSLGVAASDAEGIVSLSSYEMTSNGSSNFGVSNSDALSQAGERFDVPARPLDTVLDEARIAHVDLLKMDIEGAEFRALQGLRRRLSARTIERIILELHPDHLVRQGSSSTMVVQLLRACGYEPWRIDHSPATHRNAAAKQLTARSLLSPLQDGHALDDQTAWPHVLFVRAGLSPTLQDLPSGHVNDGVHLTENRA
jgi:FkbM family methyltransferase